MNDIFGMGPKCDTQFLQKTEKRIFSLTQTHQNEIRCLLDSQIRNCEIYTAQITTCTLHCKAA